jgi:rhodanese-related sulfurtransferase
VKKFYWTITLIMLLSLVLAACGSANPAANGNVAVNENTSTENTTAEDTTEDTSGDVAAEFTAADLDAAFSTFLADMEGYNTMSLDALNTALVEDAPFLLDVRSAEEAAGSGHIEGSVLIPLRDLADNLAYLPSFDTQIVSYCGSGWRCTIALTMLEGMGWEDVRGLKGGSYSGWAEGGYAVVEGQEPEAEMLDAVDLDPAMVAYFDEVLSTIPEGWGVVTAENLNTMIVENPDLILIDVRTTGELDEKGMIDAPNVVSIPLQDFIAEKDQWPAVDSDIVVYCGSGHRSTIAMSILWAYGYDSVLSLKDGFGGWTTAGYATVGGAYDLDEAFSIFLADMEGYNTMSLDGLNTALVEDAPFLLDVRSAEEAAGSGHIEGSVLIPLRDLADNLAYLPSFDTPIVSYCGSGWRCTIALTMLEGMGWEDVRGLKGGSYSGWADGGYAVVEGLEPEAEMLNAVDLDANTVAYFDEVLSTIPEGWGVVTAENLNTMIVENPDLILIDVRTTVELEEKGVIDAPNLVSIPLQDFIDNKDQWPAADADIVVYCGSGHRSTIAMSILWTYGYDSVLSLKDGFGGWTTAGYATAEFVAP